VADIQRNHAEYNKLLNHYSQSTWCNIKKVLLLSDHFSDLSRDAVSLWNGGIMLKKEIGFCFAWALDYVNKDSWVMTPSMERFFIRHSIRPPKNRIVLSNQNFLLPLSDRQKEAVILNNIFGLDHQTLASTMGITKGSSYGLISSIYEKLEIGKILIGENDIHDYIPSHSNIELAVQNICAKVKDNGSRKINQKNELVFHIVTCPQIEHI